MPEKRKLTSQTEADDVVNFTPSAKRIKNNDDELDNARDDFEKVVYDEQSNESEEEDLLKRLGNSVRKMSPPELDSVFNSENENSSEDENNSLDNAMGDASICEESTKSDDEVHSFFQRNTIESQKISNVNFQIHTKGKRHSLRPRRF